MISLPQRVVLDCGVSFEIFSRVTGISFGRYVAWVSGGALLIPGPWLRDPEMWEPKVMVVGVEDAGDRNKEMIKMNGSS
jgi:hypothetical protein